MEIVKRLKVINGKVKEYYQLIGDEPCNCIDCKKEKDFHRRWFNFSYKLNEDDDFALCYKHCIKRLEHKE